MMAGFYIQRRRKVYSQGKHTHAGTLVGNGRGAYGGERTCTMYLGIIVLTIGKLLPITIM